MGHAPITERRAACQMSHLLDMAVFPGTQGGPLEHIIASKAVAFGELLTDEFTVYAKQVKVNAHAMAKAFVNRGYNIISGGTIKNIKIGKVVICHFKWFK